MATIAIATSTSGAVLYALILWTALIVAPATITYLKGQYVLFGLGFLVVGIVWYIAAFRLVRPDSFWARTFYDERKLKRARQRYA